MNKSPKHSHSKKRRTTVLRSGKILASRNDLGCVYECPCGTIHVAVGPVDLKLSPEMFLEAAAMLREAAEHWSPSARKTIPFHTRFDGGPMGPSN
jgi:hypothetical protein